MQNKGAIRLVAILLLLACIWQLSFTAVTKIQENKAEKYAEQIAAQAVNDDECAMMSEAEFGAVTEDDSQVTITLSLRADTVEALRRTAAKEGRSLSAFVERVLRPAVDIPSPADIPVGED